jgi:hypothetical protein
MPRIPITDDDPAVELPPIEPRQSYLDVVAIMSALISGDSEGQQQVQDQMQQRQVQDEPL